jgi:hypothetical protein
MATEDENFDLDIYGDGGNESTQETLNADSTADPSGSDALHSTNGLAHDDSGEHIESSRTQTQQITSTGNSDQTQIQIPKQAPVQQGVKRKEGRDDDRPVDPGATSAILIQELHWWNHEDDIRGWANQAGCEDEIKDVTFNEHKVNGKSKGCVAFFHHEFALTAKLSADRSWVHISLTISTDKSM